MMELEVHWAGRDAQRIGRLYQNDRGAVFFEYDAAWRAGSRELSPIYLPNSTQGAVGTPTPGFGEVHGLFQDALPDWWGERLMQRHFESRGIPWNRVTALRKLACQGNRKMGALAFLPAMENDDFNDGMVAELGALVDAAREALRGGTGEVLAALIGSGMSPGGAQPKALLAVSDDFSEIRLDDPPRAGFGAWLCKFDIEPVLQEGRIEAAYAEMAREAEIAVPETRLLEAAGACHFLSRRFDRAGNGERLHLHSYSGLTHTPLRDGLEYADLMEIARTLTRDHRSVEEIFRRAVFNIVAANDDDHGRNHAFLMDADGDWSLAPAFDLTLATYPLASGFRAARVNGKASEIHAKDLIRLGREHDVRNPAEIIAQVVDSIANWNRHAIKHGISSGNSAIVERQHRLLRP
jgi:serine/threonine-protein kinase HipA